MLYNWNNQEYTGKMYVYCSKNAVSDVLASNHFGKASAWVSGGAYSIGARATSVSIQYRNKTGVNTTTAPASDATNWEFDLDNFQTYNTSKVYAIGSKTNYNNEHYICTVAGSTGTFQTANWTKQIISNRDVPYKLQNTAINLINSDARFVSYELLDTLNNVAYHNINLILSNGIWNETLTAPTKYTRFIGQSNLKTRFYSINSTYAFYDNLYTGDGFGINQDIFYKLNNCVIIPYYTGNGSAGGYFNFCYKNIFLGGAGHSLRANWIGHFVSNYVTLAFAPYGSTYYTASVIKNNYFKSTSNFGSTSGANGLNQVPLGNIDYNCYGAAVTIDGASKSSLSAIQASLSNQNIYSIYNAGITFNSDYTLPVGSPLIKAGSNGNNIGAEGVGYPQNTTNIFSMANGAIYRNAVLYGTTITRQQVSKTAQGGSVNDIILENASSSIDDEYKDFRISLVGGTGAGQTRVISGSNGTTKVATVTIPFDISPDSTTIYEILDGEITSATADNGSIQTFKKWLVQVTNYYDGTGYIINQNVSSSDARLDSASALTFDMRVGNASDLSSAPWRRFLQDHYLMVDNQDRGCGDANFDYTNVVSSVLTFRYNQVKIMLHK